MNAHKYNTLNKYGVTLKRLTHDKIELVRRWRNDPKISQYMEYREEITPEMQIEWFKKVDNDQNLFYLILFNSVEIGLINIKDISDGSGEGGVFIWDDHYLNSDISFRAHLALFDYFFSLNGNETIISHVLNDNLRAQRFTKFLGFTLDDNQNGVINQKYTLDKETYLSNKNRIRYTKRYSNGK